MPSSPARTPDPRARLATRPAAALTRHSAFALLAATLATTVLPAQDTRTVQFESRDVAVYNFVGTMRVVGSSGDRAEAVVTLRGADRGVLTLAHNEVRDRESLRVRYPDRAIRSPNRGRSTAWVRDDGTWGGSSDRRGGRRVELSNSSNALDASADIELRVPRGTSARVYLLVGAVDVRNVAGELHVDVSSASISAVGSRANLWLDTGSGAVRVLNASLRRASFDTGSGRVIGSFRNTPESISMDSGSGDVTVELPADAGLTLDLSTSSGKITSDFPVTVSSQSRRSLRGTIGDGRGRLEVDSGSGDLRLQIRR